MKTPTFDPQRSEAIKAQLAHMSQAETSFPEKSPLRSPRGRRPIFALAATAVIGLGLTAGFQMNASAAQAGATLKDLAQVAINYIDPQPSANEYLKVKKSGHWENCTQDDNTPYSCVPAPERIGITYKPGDEKRKWVHESIDKGHPEYDEVIHAYAGAFFGTRMYEVEDLLPHATSGQALYEYVDGSYNGGSASHAENNFVRLTAALRSGVIPAQQRAAFYDALTRVSGVTVELGIETADGRKGVAIGRTEPLRLGERSELIVDQSSGQVIGERTIMTVAVLGYGMNEVNGQSAITYSVVDQVPAATREPEPVSDEMPYGD